VRFLFVRRRAPPRASSGAPSAFVHEVQAVQEVRAAEQGWGQAGTRACVPLSKLRGPDEISEEWLSLLRERAGACVEELRRAREATKDVKELRARVLEMARRDFPPTAVIVKHPRRVVLATPYNKKYIDELKAKTKTRKFDLFRYVWYLSPSEEGKAQEIVKKHFPYVRELRLREGEEEEALKWITQEMRLALEPYRAVLGERDPLALERVEKMASENVYERFGKAITNIKWVYW